MASVDLITKQDLGEFKIELFAELKSLHVQAESIDSKKWLKSSEVRKMLKISPGTLQNLRVSGAFAFTRVRKPVLLQA